MKILLVDDEKDILEFLSYNLEKEGYKILKAKDGKTALSIAKKKIPDLIILDVMMPGIDGIQTCEEIRQIPKLKNTLITFLTARSEEYSEIAGLNSGADDYITKPIKPKILTSRIKALLRRKEKKETLENIIKINNIEINKHKRTFFYKNKEIFLSKKEFKILYFLMTNNGKVFNRDEIINDAWEEDAVVGSRTIDVHIRKIREKTSENIIKTIKGFGYKLNA